MIDASDYIPHSGSMALVDSIIDDGEGWIECLVKAKDSTIFISDDGNLPSWIGIEYMAQSIAAYAGISAKKNNKPVKQGFLLGTRDYNCSMSTFVPDCELKVRAEIVFKNDELASFKCILTVDENQIAEARINVYQPEDFKRIIEEEINE